MKNLLFVPSSDVAAELQGHQRDGLVSAHTEQDCAQFKAATVTGTRREHYKCLGVGAGCCKWVLQLGCVCVCVLCTEQRAIVFFE